MSITQAIQISTLHKENVNDVLKDGKTILFHVLEQFDPQCVQKLLELGPDVNFEASYKRTPLIHFFQAIDPDDHRCTQHYLGILKMLIDAGADVKYAPEHNSSPLHIATRRGLTDAVNLLLKFGARDVINHTDEYGNTALLIASEKGFIEIAETLLDYEADTSIENYENQTALTVAFNIKMTKIIGNTVEEKIKQLEQFLKKVNDELQDKYHALERKYDILSAKYIQQAEITEKIYGVCNELHGLVTLNSKKSLTTTS